MTRRRAEHLPPPSCTNSRFAAALVSPLSGCKASEGRPRPQKQLSQPTLGASEHMEGRLRGSQSSEGSELVHSTSVNTSSPNSATHNSDATRDSDIGRLPYGFVSVGRRERRILNLYSCLRWDPDLRPLQAE